MRRVALSEAKARLSELVRAAEAGESILIVRRGRVVAQLTPPSPWPDGVRDAPVRELDLEDLERRGVIRRPKEPPDPDLLDRPELAVPATEGLVERMIRDIREDRDGVA